MKEGAKATTALCEGGLCRSADASEGAPQSLRARYLSTQGCIAAGGVRTFTFATLETSGLMLRPSFDAKDILPSEDALSF